jgi:hypothetical protein
MIVHNYIKNGNNIPLNSETSIPKVKVLIKLCVCDHMYKKYNAKI